MSIEEMAQAHLNTIQQAIAELENQKVTIDNEILRLTEYLAKGNDLLQNQSSDAVVSND